MNICVCIKQVPASSNVKINPENGTLVRDGNNTKMNPYDLYAIETALRVKEMKDSQVRAITMGPPAATAILEEAVWMGCDDGYLLTDRKFAGADVVATSYTLSQGIKYMGKYDLVVCGKQTTDGDTAQVGPQIAEHLGIPQVSYLEDLKYDGNKTFRIKKQLEDGYQMVEVESPCLLTCLASAVKPRYMSVKGIVEAWDKEVEIWTEEKIDVSEEKLGLKGSPTKVKKAGAKEMKAAGQVHDGLSPEEAADLIIAKLKEKYII